jgi:NAD+ diphosphatase
MLIRLDNTSEAGSGRLGRKSRTLCEDFHDPITMHFEPAIDPLQPPTALGWHFSFVQGQLLLPQDENLPMAPSAVNGWADLAESRHFLGRLDGLDCWALRLAQAPAELRSVPLRAAMMQMPAALSGVAGRAAQVLEWDRTHRFCGVCGTATELQPGERARRCPACGHSAYPRLSPAMMALVWRRDRGQPELLLARAPHFVAGMFSALAGFVEAGESLEDCVKREVAEEVGLQVKNLRYYGSQSWPFPNSLMLAFTAEWAGGEIVPQPGEIEEAHWYPLDALPRIPPRFSISGHLIRDTAALLEQGGEAGI